jgi:hypothetical protein
MLMRIQVIDENGRTHELDTVENKEQLGALFGITWTDDITYQPPRGPVNKFSPSVTHVAASSAHQPKYQIKYINSTIGYVVIALQEIQEGASIGVYSGELLALDPSQPPSPRIINNRHLLAAPNKPSIVVDASGKGNFTRFLPHLPTPEELDQYTFRGAGDGSIKSRVATANISMRRQPLGFRASGQPCYGVLLVTDRKIKPGEIIGYSYGLKHWHDMSSNPSLFDRTGSVIESGYRPPTVFIRSIGGQVGFHDELICLGHLLELRTQGNQHYFIFRIPSGVLLVSSDTLFAKLTRDAEALSPYLQLSLEEARPVDSGIDECIRIHEESGLALFRAKRYKPAARLLQDASEMIRALMRLEAGQDGEGEGTRAAPRQTPKLKELGHRLGDTLCHLACCLDYGNLGGDLLRLYTDVRKLKLATRPPNAEIEKMRKDEKGIEELLTIMSDIKEIERRIQELTLAASSATSALPSRSASSASPVKRKAPIQSSALALTSPLSSTTTPNPSDLDEMQKTQEVIPRPAAGAVAAAWDAAEAWLSARGGRDTRDLRLELSEDIAKLRAGLPPLIYSFVAAQAKTRADCGTRAELTEGVTQKRNLTPPP